METILAGARLMTPEGLKKGSLAMEDGLIKGLGNGQCPPGAEDLGGDWLLPGLVELHTDNLEKHLMPRPKILWPEPGAAMEAHDAQLVSAGVTTVFDSLCVGESVDEGRRCLLALSVEALERTKKRLRADHRVHLRCEISDPEMAAILAGVAELTEVGLVSLMDHTPGERQWRDLEAYRTYWRSTVSDEELAASAAAIKARRDESAAGNSAAVVGYCRARRLPLASHDDALAEHVEMAQAMGAIISEFPATLEAARAAAQAGLAVTMGAPNLVRGRSHSGNVSAAEVAKEGLLNCLSSDYVPSSLLSGAYMLHRDCGWTLREAFRTVTETPARLAGLSDRGRLAPGLRADLVRAAVVDGRPVIKSVWVEGQRVF
ncbi:MAG: alpha-D-ribose 1-methylphosphonate 5-triphosphate diphosphatase [Deltaproteobacteria bacterium]|jgi:alpha-D-ribose 1-methylphosphonate 5-triphosphate diphosphatase|nr:alpha-D-ribose 1-methylphosphonate 5-triphosphate diphosphatase [Deltaproteobacteria bacterium]